MSIGQALLQRTFKRRSPEASAEAVSTPVHVAAQPGGGAHSLVPVHGATRRVRRCPPHPPLARQIYTLSATLLA
jgi:hypothetical protein